MSRARHLRVLAVIAVTLGPTRAAPLRAATVGANINVTADPTGVLSEPTVAIDPRDSRHLVAGAHHVNGDALALYASTDSGATWSRGKMALGNALTQTNAGLAWDSNGIAYASALGCNTTTCGIQVVKSLDFGATWSSPPLVVHEAPGNARQLIAADARPGSACRDTVCATWSDVRGGIAMDLHVACASRGEAPWRDTIVKTGAVFGAVPAFGPSGELLVAWQNLAAPSPSLEIARSDDCGQTFGATATIAAIAFPLDLGIPAMCSRRALVYPAIDIDRTDGPRRGFVYAAWTDAAPGANCPYDRCETACSSDVRVSRSEDGGATWSAPRLVHSNGPAEDQFNPWLAVDDVDGTLHVVWNDTRDDPARISSHLYYRQSPDGGLTWDSEVRVTEAPTDETAPTADPGYQYGDHNGLAVSDCSAHPMWTDRRNGGHEQIYTAPVTTAPPPADLGNTLRLTRGASTAVIVSWTDLGGDETDYRVYRGRGPDFAVNPPVLAGQSRGGDVVTWTDLFSPLAPGRWMYKVRAVGACGLERTTW